MMSPEGRKRFERRNRRMGLALARGLSIKQAKAEIGQEVEGVNTTREVYNLATERGVEMPITESIYSIINGEKTVKEAIADLMSRELKAE